jgi:predicted RNase H-like nuclease (RuvC/YqgF family)
MLYLIKEYGKNKTYLKIGYTQNLEERLKAYNTHSAEFELVNSMEGSQELEAFAHKLLADYNIKGEWFKEDPMIYYVWELTKQEYKIREQEKTIEELETRLHELSDHVDFFKEKYEELKAKLEN